MRCTRPRTVGFQADGKTLAWSQKNVCKEYATFQLPCGKCLECRLDYARQWAIRCVHEASMYENNCFITLTYSDKHLKSPKLVYADFQKFMKRLRKLQNEPMGVFVTGEYGDQTKRPHWHAIIFNWRPNDLVYSRSNERGDRIFTSATLDRLWGKNDPEKRPNEVGEVTFHSAGYCARYASKKIVHSANGKLAEADHHEWQPISKKSSKHAIGKRWLERNWRDVFTAGRLLLKLPDGQVTDTSIPRYYERWFKDNHPKEYLHYVTQAKAEKIAHASEKAEREKQEWLDALNRKRLNGPGRWVITPNERRRLITESKFQMLQNNLKLK